MSKSFKIKCPECGQILEAEEKKHRVASTENQSNEFLRGEGMKRNIFLMVTAVLVL